MPRSKSSDTPTRKATKKPIEQYEHTHEKRVNNPQVGLVKPENDPDAGKKTYQYDPHLDPQLVWAGKAEHTSFEVPTVSLHVHERIDPKTILGAVRKGNGVPGSEQTSLFDQPEEKPRSTVPASHRYSSLSCPDSRSDLQAPISAKPS